MGKISTYPFFRKFRKLKLSMSYCSSLQSLAVLIRGTSRGMWINKKMETFDLENEEQKKNNFNNENGHRLCGRQC